MKISQGTRLGKIKPTNGYGYATQNMYASLTRLGYDHSPNDVSADVEIWFDQPQHWKWSRSRIYRVGYHPWESTEIHRNWWKAMMYCHELWTPSPLIADWYRDLGHHSVHVYEHGVDGDSWSVADRKVEDKIRFLHVGGEAYRKGVDITTNAFRAAFNGNPDVELTLKMNNPGNKIEQLGNVRWINNLVPFNNLVKLFHDHHVFVYPSWGEGFGLNPLQAMATGMPTICTGAWAPYQRLLDPDLTLDSELVDSPWPKVHPGKMFKPDFDDLVDKMRWAADNYEDCLNDALPRAQAVREEYDWDRLTSKAFTALEWRLFSQGKIPNPPGL